MTDEGGLGLKPDALSLPEAVIMGIAGTAPAYSMAATTATLIAVTGILAPASLLICGLVMFGVAFAFLHLTRLDPNAGAAYIWVKQTLHPVLGFFAGWAMLVMSALFMVSGTVPAATAMLQILAPGFVQNMMAVTLVAAFLMILIGLIVLKGIKLSSHFQVILTLIEVGIVAGLIIAALFASFAHPAHALSFGLLLGQDFTPSLFVSGALVAVYFYAGWDVTANLNEETRNPKRSGGVASVLAMLALMLMLIGFSAACLLTLSDDDIQKAGTDIVTTVAARILPAPWSSLAVIAVVLSTIGTLETNILQFTRTLFAMARDGVFARRYARVHAVHQTPWLSTVLVTAIGLGLLLLSSSFSSVSAIMKASASALGFQIAFYYALSCLACAWCLRRGFRSSQILLTGILWPLISALFLFGVAIGSLPTFDGVTLFVSLGSLAFGAVPLLLSRMRSAAKA
ncbi:APC family permease [Beijerinckia indica]|uniref:Amino acid permease-associated region n=1 Tax=Beijerinckia indica subsp. indica (strain ATCC 9039 / DSM 1715 / NCIMB 8712) TaxID=395963 RepID=B2IFL6_BEII9|nr:APC family permease [Beijerinckia indica]ACB94227.1 amino acid permease-associated region [Beijerinckia indica subsp. indica ATCC 9039]